MSLEILAWVVIPVGIFLAGLGWSGIRLIIRVTRYVESIDERFARIDQQLSDLMAQRERHHRERKSHWEETA